VGQPVKNFILNPEPADYDDEKINPEKLIPPGQFLTREQIVYELEESEKRLSGM
jgi:hypothetical protein